MVPIIQSNSLNYLPGFPLCRWRFGNVGVAHLLDQKSYFRSKLWATLPLLPQDRLLLAQQWILEGKIAARAKQRNEGVQKNRQPFGHAATFADRPEKSTKIKVDD